MRYVFGPVPSRRLGLSLGINNVPYKTCSCSCVYCQLGKTIDLTVSRRCFYDPSDIVKDVEEALKRVGHVDYVTFVPDGEPLLDACIEKEIRGVRELGAKVAILTNASLLQYEDVIPEILEASYICVKIDAVSDNVWREINRPHQALKIDRIVDGIKKLSKMFRGVLTTETMLVNNVNTDANELKSIAKEIRGLSNLHKAYIAVPIRPPAEPWAKPPNPEKVVEAYHIFSNVIGSEKVELLITPEPPKFTVFGDPRQWLLSTTAVHPLRYDYAVKALEKVCRDPVKVIEDLVKEGEIAKIVYNNTVFLVREFRKGVTH